MDITNYQSNLKHHQAGAATLMISLILLFSITLMTLYAARNNVVETQITANDYRIKQAHEASQAGLEAVLASLYSLANRGVIADGDNDGVIDNNNIPQTTVTLDDGASYTVTYSNPVAGDISLLNISVTGKSNDDVGTRKISQMVQILPFNLNAPNTGLTAGGNVQIGGSAQINNSAAVAAQSTVVAGGTISAFGAGWTGRPQRGTCTGGSAGYTTSDPYANGITPNDNTVHDLAVDTNAFFSNFFGISKAQVQAMAQNVGCNRCQASDFTGMEGSIIWVDGDLTLSGNGDIGSPDKPVLLIVNGNLDMGGNTNIYGLVYAVSSNNNGGGNTRIEGAAIVETNFSVNGNLCIDYNPNLAGGPGSMSGPIAKVAGGWRDF